jgi:hypothetical protein
MGPKEIRGWLLCQPRPVSLRITNEDQAAHTLEIKPGQSWAQTAESVHALKPELIEALDDDGKLIRAVRPGDVESDEEADESEGIPVLANDPESARLMMFARLIADAYKHSTDVAFARLADLLEVVNNRATSLERTVDSLNRLMVRQAMESADGGGGGEKASTFEEMMMSAFMQGQAQKTAAKAAAATKPNGAPAPTKTTEGEE